MDLFFHPAATRDARTIAERYAKVSEQLVARFWSELDAAIDLMANHPERRHFDPSGMRRSNLKKFPYHVLFEERLDGVWILVIRHHRRNPNYGLRRQG